MNKTRILGIVLGLILLSGAAFACDGAAQVAVNEPDVAPAVVTAETLDGLFGQIVLAQNAPPRIPGNRCEAQCVAEFRQCQAICRDVICLIACEDLFELCFQACNPPTA